MAASAPGEHGLAGEAELRFYDIGGNLLDDMYKGEYRGKPRHPADLPGVLERGWAAGVKRIIITAGNLQEAKAALELARTDPRLVCTVGVHPTRCLDFLPSEDAAGVLAALEAADDTAEWAPTEAQLEHAKQYFEELQALVLQGSMEGKVVAIGECGLDYDRLQFCPAAVQRYFLEWHFQLARSAGLPMFLHNRNAGSDFLAMVRRAAECFPYAVSHSFTGSAAEAAELVEAGLYIGVNGCSLKTQESCDVVASIPLDRLMLETDCPWCDIRPTHAGHKHVQSTWPTNKEKKWAPDACVKSRSEPCHIVQVAEVVAGVKGLSVAEVAEAAWQNTVAVFGKPVSA